MNKEILLERDKVAETKKHWVRLTRACNNKCLFCLDKDAQNGSVISREEIIADFEKGRQLGIKRVILSGGDPTIHPEFLSIVQKAKTMQYTHIQVITNGRMFAYRDFLQKVLESGVDEITFSFHGHNAKLHDSLTQVKGSFNQSLQGLYNALRAKGVIISIDVVVNKLNVVYLSKILEYFIYQGVTEFELLNVIPFGRAWERKEELFYDFKEYYPYLKKAFNYALDSRLHIWLSRFPPEVLGDFSYLIQHPYKLHDEIDGRRKMFEDFLSTGKEFDCYGLRCQYCYIKNFCQDLIALRKNGSITSYPYPRCLNNLSKEEGKTFSFSESDLDGFLDFYIQYRYFIKEKKCCSCTYDQQCAGMQCDYIRKHGFGVLKPIIIGNSPYQLLRLLLKCNANCSFCNVLDDGRSQSRLPLVEAKAIIDKIVFQDERARLDISGGEPTLSVDLPKVIEYAKYKGVEVVQVQTNGINLSKPNYIKTLKLAGLDKLFVALHAPYSEIHDRLVGVKGAFDKCVLGINRALSENIEVILNPVITTENYKFLVDYVKFVHKEFRSIKYISLSVVQPRGRAWQNSYLVPKYSLISPYINEGLKISKDLSLVLNNPYCGVPFCVGGWEKYLEQCVEYSHVSFRSQHDKIKAKQCQKCLYNDYCNGVWKEYYQLHLFDGIKAIQK